ncbi:MAG: cadherin-like beta sandwich domain-containing protein [Solirubrobacteraceae bacterium]
MRRRIAKLSLLATAVAVALGVLMLPAVARAADETVSFDDLAAGAIVTSQYHDFGGPARGVDFGVAPPLGLPSGPDVIVQSAASQARSPANVATATFCVPHAPDVRAVPSARRIHPTGDCYDQHIWGRFTYAKQHVSVYAGEVGAAFSGGGLVSYTLTGYDASGNVLASDTASAPLGGGVDTLLEVSLAAPQIVYFSVTGGAGLQLSIDDLTFDNPLNPPPPDFSLALAQTLIQPGTQGGVVQGQSRAFTVNVSRFNNSTGNIHLTINESTLPAGVSADVQPADTNDPAGAGIVVNFTATANAPAAQNVPVQLIATPADAHAGPSLRILIIPLSVEAVNEYDPEITGIEVTQGIQTATLPGRNPFNLTGPVPYSGVKLVAGRKTVVRVWANNLSAEPAAGVPAGVELYGYDQAGHELPGSPLGPDGGPATLAPNGVPVVTNSTRTDATSSWDFTLPGAVQEPQYARAWAAGTITLVAKFAYLPDTPVLHECSGCGQLSSFTLRDIPFVFTGAFELLPVALSANGTSPADPWTVFTPARNLLPEDFIIQDYRASLDISSIANSSESRSDKNSDVLDVVEDWDDDNGYSFGNYPVGVAANVDVGVTSNDILFNGSDRPISVVDQRRPLTSVAHELGHGLGRLHASGCNGGGSNGQQAEGWPPDEQGWIEGIGLDTSGAGAPAPGQYRVIADPAPDPSSFTPAGGASGKHWFDFMSYCAAAILNGEFNAWTSDRGWNEVVNRYQTAADRPGRDVRLAFGSRLIRPRSISGPSVRVGAVIGSDVRVAFVKPGDGRPLPPGLASGYRLAALDANGHTLSATTMMATPGHADRLGTFTYVVGELPARNVKAVEVMRGSAVMAKVVRPPHSPRVKLVFPTAGATVGGGRAVTVRWRATDADHRPLRAKVDFSGDDGRHWQPIYIGPNRNRAVLGSGLLSRSRQARVRIRINDGFNETARISPRFTSRGAPPAVHIFNPIPGAITSAGAFLYLNGVAADDAGHILGGRSLRWFDGGRPIALGATASYFGLGPGRHTIRLVATDRYGRRGVASVSIGLGSARVTFLVLRAPARVGRRARSVTLIVAASLQGATLTVGGRRFRVSRNPRRIKVPVRPGGSVLTLRLTLADGGPVTTRVLKIRRR